MGRWPVAVLLLGSAVAAVLVFRQAPPPERPRDRVVAAAIPDAERLSIVAFGTSLTQRALWPERLGTALRDCGFREAAVTVRARPGAGSAEGLALIGSDAARPRHLALIEFAINDADLVDGVSRGTSLANHRAMIAALRARHPGIAVLLVTTNPVAGLQRLKRPKLMAYDDLYPRLAGEMGAKSFRRGRALGRDAGLAGRAARRAAPRARGGSGALYPSAGRHGRADLRPDLPRLTGLNAALPRRTT